MRHATGQRFYLPPHLAVLNSYLLQIALRKINRLMVFMPPRHGKSELCSHYFPPWYLGWFPYHRVILTSYEATFAESWGRKARDTMEEFGGLWDSTPRSVSQASGAASHWSLEGFPDGGMQTSGVGGPLTGKGADIFIIDDPVKNQEEAQSSLMRQKQHDWYISTARTRLEPGAAMILIMTRWNEDDLAGRLVEEMSTGGDQWTVLSFPGLAEEGDSLGRKEGEPLWPERFDKAYLEQTRRLNRYWFASMYQQRPAPEGGGLFQRKDFRYFRALEHEYVLVTPQGAKRTLKSTCWRFATVDLAVSLNQRADYTVISTWDVTQDGDLLLLDRWRGRIEGPDTLPTIKAEWQRWGHDYVAIERAGYQLSVVQDAQRAGIPTRPLNADRDKFSRAQTAAAYMDAGMIYFPAEAMWLHEWEDELLNFPNGVHDDQVDTLAYAALEVARTFGRKSEIVEMSEQYTDEQVRLRRLGLDIEDERYYDKDVSRNGGQWER